MSFLVLRIITRKTRSCSADDDAVCEINSKDNYCILACFINTRLSFNVELVSRKKYARFAHLYIASLFTSQLSEAIV